MRLHSKNSPSSRTTIAAECLALVAVIGFVDYLLGYDRSLLVGYLVPIASATWLLGPSFGIGTALLSVTTWMIADLASGVPSLRLWNASMGLISYIAFTWLLGQWRSLLLELDERVQKRTAELTTEIAARTRLEREVAQVTERERRRLGQDLHDSICQHLTGTSLVAQAVSENLAASFSSEAERAAKVVRLIVEGIDMARNLARGCFSPDLEAEGLAVALQGLAQNSQQSAGVRCQVSGDQGAHVRDATTATQLYRIAQEAVTNAIKHGQPDSISIDLAVTGDALTLTVSDDGRGLPTAHRQGEGLGLRLMAHAAGVIGGELSIKRCDSPGGTIIRCTVPTGAKFFGDSLTCQRA